LRCTPGAQALAAILEVRRPGVRCAALNNGTPLTAPPRAMALMVAKNYTGNIWRIQLIGSTKVVEARHAGEQIGRCAGGVCTYLKYTKSRSIMAKVTRALSKPVAAKVGYVP